MRSPPPIFLLFNFLTLIYFSSNIFQHHFSFFLLPSPYLRSRVSWKTDWRQLCWPPLLHQSKAINLSMNKINTVEQMGRIKANKNRFVGLPNETPVHLRKNVPHVTHPANERTTLFITLKWEKCDTNRTQRCMDVGSCAQTRYGACEQSDKITAITVRCWMATERWFWPWQTF